MARTLYIVLPPLENLEKNRPNNPIYIMYLSFREVRYKYKGKNGQHLGRLASKEFTLHPLRGPQSFRAEYELVSLEISPFPYQGLNHFAILKKFLR